MKLSYGTLCFLLLASSFRALAQEGPDEEEDLFEEEFELLGDEEVVLAAAKHRQPIGFSPSTVIVITAKDIEDSGASTFVEVLRTYPAVYILLINPSHTMLHIRGSYRVLLLLDGRELNPELFPAPFYESLPVGVHDIERIEIVLGPSSALYGANAVAAVISVTTRRPGPGLQADASLAAGQNGALVLGGRAGHRAGRWGIQVLGGMEQENSLMIPSGAVRDLSWAGLSASLDLGDCQMTASAGLRAGNMRLFSDALGYLPLDDLFLSYAQTDLEYAGLRGRAYWYGMRSQVGLEMDLINPVTGIRMATISPQSVAGDTFHIEGQYSLELIRNNLLIVGADFRYTRFHSDGLVHPTAIEFRTGFFVHDEQRFYERLLVMASLRFDYNSVTDPALNPKLALVYNPAGEHYLRATVGTAFRKPTLVETSVDFKINVEPGYEVLKILFEDIGISNRDLKNEILTNGEIGYQGFLLDRRLRLSTNIYFSNYRRSIELDSVIVTDNLGRIDLERTRLGYVNSDIEENSLGAGFGIEGEPLEWLTLFTRGEYFIEWYERDGDWSRNRDIFSAAAGVTLRLESGLGTQLALVYNGRYPNDFVRNPESVLSPTNVLDLPARTYLLASLSYRFDIGRGRLWAGVHFQNPFGARFREKAGIVLPDGSNYGGELSGPRVQGWLRWEY